ncbi:glycosyltransferase family 39 protein [bacterium]|nr:glycosyltransferase family 39 protein [bacterium]
MGDRGGEPAGRGAVNPDGARRSVVVGTLTLSYLLVVLLSLHFHARAFVSGNGDAADYASMGRNLARGEGFRSSVVYPLQLAMFCEEDPHRAPNLHRPPLLPLVYGALFLLLGAHGWIVWAVSAAMLAATAFVIVRSGRLPWEARAAGAAALLAYPTTVVFAASGMTEPAAALVCVFLAARLSGHSWKTRRGAVVLGGLAGLAALLKYPLAMLLPFVLWAAWRGAESRLRWKAPTTIGAAWLAVVLPWWVHNAVVVGDPFFTLQSRFEVTKGLPGYELFRVARSDSPVEPLSFAAQNAAALAGKSLAAWRGFFLSDWGLHAWPLLLGLAVAWVWRKREEARALPWWIAVNAALLLALAPINLEPRYLYPTLMPLWVGAISLAFAQTSGRARTMGATALLLLLLGTNVHVIQARPRPGDFSRDVAMVRSATAPGDLVLTDVDSFVAWHADRTALWFPCDERTLERMLERHDVRAVYLQGGVDSEALYHFRDRRAVLRGLRARFEVEQAAPGGGVLLTRHSEYRLQPAGGTN